MVDKILPRDSPFESNTFVEWKGDTIKVQDNDVSPALAEEPGMVRGFSFRGDVRDQTTGFLGKMVDLCEDLGFMLRRPGGDVIFNGSREAVRVPPSVSAQWMADFPPAARSP